MAQNMKENKMGTMKELPLLINISLPMMISMLVTAMYNIVDSVFVSRISEDALTAVSLAFPLQTLMIALAAGTGVGVNALVSRALGEKNQNRVNAVAMNGLFIYAVSYLVVLLAALLAVRPFYALQTAGGQAEIAALGTKYLTIVMAFSFGLYSEFIFERLLQSTGRTVLTMISQTTGAIVNIILDPIMIFGLFGVPAMGITGAAVATVLGQMVAGAMAIFFNHRYNHEVQLKFAGFCPDRKIIGSIYRIAVPAICMQAIGSVMTSGMNLILMGINSTAAAVFGVYFKIQSFFFMPVIGLNNGLIPILSYNYGAKNRRRMTNSLKYAYIIAAAFLLLGMLAFELIPDKLLMIFSASESMIEIGTNAFRVIGVHFILAWFCIVTGALFQSVGRSEYSMYVSLARQLVVLLPAAYFLAKIGGLTLIWWSFPIAELMSLLITLWCFVLIKRKVLDKMD